VSARVGAKHLSSEPFTGLRVPDEVVDEALHQTEVATSAYTNNHLIHVSFKDLTCSYSGQKGKTTLHGVNGTVCSGNLTAIMVCCGRSELNYLFSIVIYWVSLVLYLLKGPSGAAKSTLLDILAMRKTVGTVSGAVYVNGLQRADLKSPGPRAEERTISRSAYRRITSYIPQEDLFLPTMSVLEVS